MRDLKSPWVMSIGDLTAEVIRLRAALLRLIEVADHSPERTSAIAALYCIEDADDIDLTCTTCGNHLDVHFGARCPQSDRPLEAKQTCDCCQGSGECDCRYLDGSPRPCGVCNGEGFICK